MNEGQQANYLSTVAHRFRRVLFLCVLERRERVQAMLIFWLSCTSATNRMPFAMTYHNQLQLAENQPIYTGACCNHHDVMIF